MAAFLAFAPLTTQIALADCASGDASACTSTQEIRQQFLQQRADRALAADPQSDRISGRFNGNLWDPNANGAAPFNVAPGDHTATLNTSLSKWGSYVSRNDARIIEEAKKLAPEDLKLPAPVTVQDQKVDVWTQSRIEAIGASDATMRGHTTYLGADYAVNRELMFGAVTQLEDIEQSSDAWATSADGRAFMAGPYMAMRVSPNLTLDAKAAWGQGHGSIGSDAGSLDTQRSLAEARLKGNWNVKQWRLSPSASVSRLTEISTSVPGTQVEIDRLSIAPEISRPIALGNGRTLEPSLHYKNSLDLNAAETSHLGSAFEALGDGSTVGGGLTFSKPDEYTIRATTDVEGLDNDTDPDLRSRVQVNIPLD